MRLSDVETRYADKCRDLSQLEAKVQAMKDFHKSVQDELSGVRLQVRPPLQFPSRTVLDTEWITFSPHHLHNEILKSSLHSTLLNG